MENHGKSWEIMGNHGKSWEIMGDHGKSWEIMGNHWKSWEIMGIVENQNPVYIFKILKVRDHIFIGIRRSTSFFRGHYRLKMLSLKWPIFIQLSFIKLIS